MLPYIKRYRKRHKDEHISLKGLGQFKVSRRCVDYQYPETYPSGHYYPLVIVGDAPGADDDFRKTIFSGIAGRKLDAWMASGHFKREDVLLANVFRHRPEKNDIKHFFRPPKFGRIPVCDDLVPKSGLYLAEHFRPDINHLKKMLFEFRPEVVITLGDFALWSVMNEDISVARFSGPEEKPHFCTLVYKATPLRFILLPAYHPASFLRTKDQNQEDVSVRAFKHAQKILRPASL